MANLADYIENFILRRLSIESDNVVVLNRNDLAAELACAPSQISYVVNTRFTVDRGFVVESRRGSGGFIRIARHSKTHIIYEEAASRILPGYSNAQINELIDELRHTGLMTRREAALMAQFLNLMQERLDPSERVASLRAILCTLSNFSREA